MESKVNYSVVGVFVIVLTIALITMIIWLSSGLRGDHYKTYIIYMDESVSGLSIKAPVKYSGVDVGFVKTMEINPKNPQQVKLLLSISEDTLITDDVVASLKVQGLTGIAYIGLTKTGASMQALGIRNGEKYPVIRATLSTLARLDTAVTQMTENVNHVLDTENQLALKEILKNLQVITNILAVNNKEMNVTLRNMAKASNELPMATQTLALQTLPTTNQVLDNLRTITDNVVEITQMIKQNPSVLIRGEAPRAPGPGE